MGLTHAPSFGCERLELVLPHWPEVVTVDVALMEVATDA